MSHNPSEITLICCFGSQKIFLISIDVVETWYNFPGSFIHKCYKWENSIVWLNSSFRRYSIITRVCVCARADSVQLPVRAGGALTPSASLHPPPPAAAGQIPLRERDDMPQVQTREPLAVLFITHCYIPLTQYRHHSFVTVLWLIPQTSGIFTTSY